MLRLRSIDIPDELISGCWNTMTSTVCDIISPTETAILKRYETHENAYKLIFEVLTFIIINPNNTVNKKDREEFLSTVSTVLLDKLDKFYYVTVRSHITRSIMNKDTMNITLLGNVMLPVLSNKDASLIDIFTVIMLMFTIDPTLPSVEHGNVFIKNMYMKSLAYVVMTTDITSGEYMTMNSDTLDIKEWLLKCLNLEDPLLKDLPTDKWVVYVINAIKYLGMCGILAHQCRYTFTDRYVDLSRIFFEGILMDVRMLN